MSFYLKYRPQKVAELDLDSVRTSLQAMLTTGTFSHAYLFSGPKGTGKTSSARILAKVVNCRVNSNEHGVASNGSKTKNSKPVTRNTKLEEPCGECASCKAIVSGSSLAVVEIDAASNRGIDDIRALKEKVAVAPSGGRYMVYVIDEVHMLTTEAFNALLKTLEEPPEHVIFVLCTTEAHKVPDTILSRCTRIIFKKASVKEIVTSLQKAVTGEKLKPEAGVLEAIAQRVDGSFRDAMKTLEQLAQQSEDIALASVDKLTGFSDEYSPELFIQTLRDRDTAAGLAEIEAKANLGVDIGVWGRRVVESLRKMLIDKISPATKEIPDRQARNSRQAVEDDAAGVKSLPAASNSASVSDLLTLISLFSEAVLKIKTAVLPQLPLEMAVVEWGVGKTQNSKLKTQNSEISQKERGEKSEIRNQPDSNGVEFNSAPQVHQKVGKPSLTRLRQEKESLRNQQSESSERNSELSSQKSEGEIASSGRSGSLVGFDLTTVEQRWNEMLAQIRTHNISLEALLKATRPVEVHQNRLKLQVLYAFHKEQLEQNRHRDIIEKVLAHMFQGSCTIEMELATVVTKPPADGVANVTGKLQDENLAEAAEEIFG